MNKHNIQVSKLSFVFW